ncbi:MAG: LCP family protein [Dehalococcoidia bacterium]
MPLISRRHGVLPAGRIDLHRLRRPRYIALAILALIGLGYASLAVSVHVSRTILPGNEVHLPSAVQGLPYLSASGPDAGHKINILILGIDHRSGLTNYDRPGLAASKDDPGLSDTLAVLSVDPASKTASLLSIPRDLWLEVPDGHGGWTTDRINTAYFIGEVNQIPGGGPASAEMAIKHNFGISIDHYVVLDFNGFMQLIDAAGGIDLDVQRTITATVLPKSNDGGYEYTFLAGRQHLNGELALAYARFRLDQQGDFGRIRRQQEVALAARDRALSLGWLNPFQASNLWDKYNSAVQTDLPGYQIPGYALLAKQIQGHGIQTRSLGEPGATSEVILPGSGADVLFPNPSIVARIVGDTFNDTTLRDETFARLQRIYPAPGAIPQGTATVPTATSTPTDSALGAGGP